MASRSMKFPRLLHRMYRVRTPGVTARSMQGSNSSWACVRDYFRNRGPSNLPIRRGFPFEDFFPRAMFPFGRLMENNFRNMERFMDEVMSRPSWVEHTRPAGAKEVQVKYNDKIYEVKVDVSDYAPEDLNVRVASDKLTISGQYQQRHDQHSMVSREFNREFFIPENVDGETMECQLSEDGYLAVRAKVKGAEETPERTIKIEREDPQKSKEESKDEK